LPATRHKLAVPEGEAARLLSLTKAEFAALVQRGALPRPVMVGPYARWSVASLEATLSGTNIPDDDFET
jgi:predicted DNA-binding transcriptional regulator AlpA